MSHLLEKKFLAQQIRLAKLDNVIRIEQFQLFSKGEKRIPIEKRTMISNVVYQSSQDLKAKEANEIIMLSSVECKC